MLDAADSVPMLAALRWSIDQFCTQGMHRTSKGQAVLRKLGVAQVDMDTDSVEHQFYAAVFREITLTAWQRACPMSLAVTWGHFSTVQEYVDAGGSTLPPTVVLAWWALSMVLHCRATLLGTLLEQAIELSREFVAHST